MYLSERYVSLSEMTLWKKNGINTKKYIINNTTSIPFFGYYLCHFHPCHKEMVQ
jgi:hypothetical protein